MVDCWGVFLLDQTQSPHLIFCPANVRKQSLKQSGTTGLSGVKMDDDSFARGALAHESDCCTLGYVSLPVIIPVKSANEIFFCEIL
jgi:hypothetical protein